MRCIADMRYILPVCLLALSARAGDGRIADAIYRAEGAQHARVPYGILSVKVRNADEARRVCLNTIRDAREHWVAAGRPGNFIDFLADIYCPAQVDPAGNRHWKHNVDFFLK